MLLLFPVTREVPPRQYDWHHQGLFVRLIPSPGVGATACLMISPAKSLSMPFADIIQPYSKKIRYFSLLLGRCKDTYYAEPKPNSWASRDTS